MSLTHRTSHKTINLRQIRVTGTDHLGTHPNQHLPSSRCSIIVIIPKEAGRKGAESREGTGTGEQRGGQAGHPQGFRPPSFPRASLQPGGLDGVHPRPEASPWPPGRDRGLSSTRPRPLGRNLPATQQAPRYLVDDAPRGRTRQHVIALRVKSEESAPGHLDLLVAAVTGQHEGARGVGGQAVLGHLQATLVDVPLDELQPKSMSAALSVGWSGPGARGTGCGEQ